MNKTSDNRALNFSVLALMFTVSFALGLVVPYAQHLAYGVDPSWGYRIIKGVIVSMFCTALFWFAGKYGSALLQKYRKPILYIGTGLILAFTLFAYPLKRIDLPDLSRIIAYAYAALPFLGIVTICAMALCLKEVLSSSFSFQNAVLIVVSTLLTISLENTLKTVMLVLFVYLLISGFKAKTRDGKIALIIISVLSIGLFLYLAYEWITALKFLIGEWDNPAYMSLVSRNVWSQAKPFGTMDNLKAVGGNISDFALLWMVGFLGIVPAILIVLALAALIVLLLKKHRDLSPISVFAVIYLIVRASLSLLTSCGIFFRGFMTPMPLIMDTVAGMFCVFWLLGVKSSYKYNETTLTEEKA